MARVTDHSAALMLYKGQKYTFINGNVLDANPVDNLVIYHMKPGDNLVHVDSGNGIAVPPSAPETVPAVEETDYPIAAAPVRLILPERGAAAGQFYCIVAQCATNPITIRDDGTDTLLSTLSATGDSILLYCDGLAWYEIQTSKLIP